MFSIGLVALVSAAAVELLLLMPVAWYVYTLGSLLLLASSFRRRQRRLVAWRFATAAVATAIAALLYFIPWTTRKPFLRDLDSIRPGMTEQQVRARMAPYIEGTGWPANPFVPSTTGELKIQSALVFRHSNDGAYNSDWGIIRLAHGRVTLVEFSAD